MVDWHQVLKDNRPAGWEESDDEVRVKKQAPPYYKVSSRQRSSEVVQDDDIVEEQFQPLALPEYSNTLLGNTCSFVHKCTATVKHKHRLM